MWDDDSLASTLLLPPFDVSALSMPSRGCVFLCILTCFLLLLFNDVMISDSSDKNPAYTHGSLLQVPTTPLSVPLLLLQLTDVVTRFLSIVAVDQIRLRNNLTNTTLYYPMLLLHLNSRHTRPDHRNANLLRSPFFALFFLPVTLTHSPTGLTD